MALSLSGGRADLASEPFGVLRHSLLNPPMPLLPIGSATVATDGSFAGLLCAYAAAHRAGALPASVVVGGREGTGGLFGAPEAVATDGPLAERIERGLERARPHLVGKLFRAFLSEEPGIEVAILRLIDAVAAEGGEIVADWTFEPARLVSKASKRVGREAHRMEAFVRFERHAEAREEGAASGERWLARVRPEVHVLPVIAEHFASRYPALRWTILDQNRGLALVHDTPAAELAPEAPATRIVPASSLPDLAPTADETAYQRMWRAYFRSVDIPERRNLKLHLRHVPKRYWPDLTEKRPEVGALAETEPPAETPAPEAAPRRAVKPRGPGASGA